MDQPLDSCAVPDVADDYLAGPTLPRSVTVERSSPEQLKLRISVFPGKGLATVMVTTTCVADAGFVVLLFLAAFFGTPPLAVSNETAEKVLKCLLLVVGFVLGVLGAVCTLHCFAMFLNSICVALDHNSLVVERRPLRASKRVVERSQVRWEEKEQTNVFSMGNICFYTLLILLAFQGVSYDTVSSLGCAVAAHVLQRVPEVLGMSKIPRL